MTEYSGAKAPSDPGRFRDFDKQKAYEEYVVAFGRVFSAVRQTPDNGEVMSWSLGYDAGFRAGQRAQAETDAEIAEKVAFDSPECVIPSYDDGYVQAGEHIAAAIRAAAPKEGE